MPNICFTPVLGKRLRAVKLDSCGGVPTDAAEDTMIATDGFISVSLSAEVEDGNEILTKKADGSICVNEMQASTFKRFTVEAEFCGVDPGLLSIMTNAEIYQNWDGDNAGIVVPEGTIAKQFSLELWTGLSGQACQPGVEEASGYMLLPFVRGGTLGDVKVDGENAVTFSLTNSSTKGGNSWGVGPFNVLDNVSGAAAPLPTALDPLDHLLLISTNIAPPVSACGLQAFKRDTAPSGS